MSRIRDCRRPNRAGVVYLVVLMASLIVATMALSAIETARWQVRSEREQLDSLQTMFVADSALEYALARINADTAWRSNHRHNEDSLPIDLGGVSIVYRLLDEDENLADDPYDSADLIVTASYGNSRFSWQATLTTRGEPLDCLNHAVASNDRMRFHDGAVVATDDSVASNARVVVDSGGHLTADCHVSDFASGNIYGTIYALPSDLQYPSSSLFSEYRNHGTEIKLSSLPYSGGYYRIHNALLSNSVNSISGDVDPKGVYFIDCDEDSVSISDSRLQCTLVLLDTEDTLIEGSVHWEAAVTNYPILLTSGDLELSLSRNLLLESSVGINLNPSSFPYQGLSDSSSSGSFPSQCRGLVYSGGNVTFSSGSSNELFGTLIAEGQVRGDGQLFVHSRDIYSANPPPGFQTSQDVHIVSGSIRRVSPPE